VRSLTAFVYLLGSVVCHQIPERSFYASGVQFPVCARCTGLYLGGLIGLAIWLVYRPRVLTSTAARRALLVAALPTLLTLITADLGWWDPANVTRAALAAPLGGAGALVVAAGLARNLR
jgi:uncharacterized membrane protein